MDQIKKLIANAIEAQLLGSEFKAMLPYAKVEVSRLTELQWQVRVRSEDRAPRYFNVRLSELI